METKCKQTRSAIPINQAVFLVIPKTFGDFQNIAFSLQHCIG